MPAIFNREQIEEALRRVDVTAAIEQGFIAYSEGKVVVPPVGELVFEDPPGDVHIKYGYIKHDDYFVIKVASGFYDNVKLGLPPADGLMLVFSQKTAQLECVLLDECHLTNVRTAAAGAVVARYLAPKTVERIGVFGARGRADAGVERCCRSSTAGEVVVWGTGERSSCLSRGHERTRTFNRTCPTLARLPPPATSSSPPPRAAARCCVPSRSGRARTSRRWAPIPRRRTNSSPGSCRWRIWSLLTASSSVDCGAKSITR
jgi:hypothetical protein